MLERSIGKGVLRMKQYITIEQIRELNVEQIGKLSHFINSKIAITDDIKSKDSILNKGIIATISCQCNIGKMIEILGDRFDGLERCWEGYWVHLYDSGEKERFEGKELCDALWEAIKYVLREEE